MNGMLARLYRSKAAESAADASIESYEDVARLARERQKGRRPFRRAIERAEGAAIVAEVKHASPSAGVIVGDFDAVRIARFYEEARADAISVLTEFAHFKGRLAHLDLVRTCTTRPILRKDFLSTPYEMARSAAHGADAVLLIVAGLSDAQPRVVSDRSRDVRPRRAGRNSYRRRASAARSTPARRCSASTTAICRRSRPTFG